MFDQLYLDGRSLLEVPLEDRKRLLRSVLKEHPRVRYAAHDETNACKLGDKVELVESRPYSKTKRFRVFRITEKAREDVQ